MMSPYVVLHNQHYGNLVKDLGAHYLGINQFAQEDQVIDKRDFSRLHEYFFNLPYILAAKSSSAGSDFSNTFIFSIAESAFEFKTATKLISLSPTTCSFLAYEP